MSIRNNRRQSFWWSDDIARLRAIAVQARRRVTRSRRNRNLINDAESAYRLAKRALRIAIKRAKNKAWSELIATIDKDPWGLPYKIVLGKLRRSSPTHSETLERDSLKRLIESLFPNNIISTHVRAIPLVEWDEEFAVSPLEVERFVVRRMVRNSAPGPDNVKATIWKKVPPSILQHLAILFTSCMKEGIFPIAWKRAILVLIPKGPMQNPTNVVKARPICLLDEIGKILERIIATPMTLIISSSNRLFGAIVSANIQIARVIRHMAELGLSIAEDKTEAVLFCDKKPNLMPSITVGNSYIPVGESMKYLGVKIDSFWNFHAHFTYVEAKLNKVLRALNRIMPNLRGPGEKKRRLYATVMTSVMTYAAPIWKGALHSSPYKVQKPLCRMQRIIAIRVIAAYRTTSFDAATLLARMPPWLLEVSLRERVYLRIDESKRLGTFSPLEVNKIKKEESIVLIRQWKALLNEPNTWGKKTIAAILPFLDRWLDRKHGQITYHVAQMLTGHGSFGHFLWRINKRETSAATIVSTKTIHSSTLCSNVPFGTMYVLDFSKN